MDKTLAFPCDHISEVVHPSSKQLMPVKGIMIIYTDKDNSIDKVIKLLQGHQKMLARYSVNYVAQIWHNKVIKL